MKKSDELSMGISRFRTLSFSLLLFPFVGRLAHADVPLCLEGSEKKAQIHQMIAEPASEGSLLQYYQRSVALKKGPLLPAVATQDECCQVNPPLQQVKSEAQKIMDAIQKTHIKRECFVAAMKRQFDTSEYFCPSSSFKGRVSLGVSSEKGQCLTDEIVDYTRWAFHEAIACMSDPQKPIDPLTIFALMNNESALHFYVASKGGVGIGQLTTAAIKAVNNSSRFGVDYIEQIRESSNPHCAPFRRALEHPLENSYSNGYCPLLQPSEGLARSLVYSISYYLMTRDSLMTKVNNFLMRKNEERAPFFNYAALAMYGPTALQEQSQVIDAYLLARGSVKAFVQMMRKKIPYVSNTIRSAEDVIRSEDTHIQHLSDCLE
jgi:hypothetical protein